MEQAPVLELEHVDTFYGSIQVLYDINIRIHEGELVCLLGGNASGKSTTLKTILGICKIKRGTVRLMGERIDGKPTKHIIARGVAIVPENRRIFPRLTVLENMEMGAYLRKDPEGVKKDIERMLDLFPRLGERLHRPGMTLSGGEQQMLAMARALLSNPKVLLMDEPSMGLAPILVDQQFELIKEVNRRGTTIFVVEQNANMALSIADRGYVLQTGAILLTDTAEKLLANDMMKRAYLATGG
ncbi:MAG: ABC transporter ATP-binding protein [Deltaproteobacteria bacterium]|nr:ABC transporter ATP-binding protein [Deltaproteobacteria bacterium]MBW2015488.1 ABC transporter ATP-binding protein [Deltaproteobacteria bacterium]MBW2303908.1 ABC transporter ATP-binding protein [Deltaproteobacteria bacterium]